MTRPRPSPVDERPRLVGIAGDQRVRHLRPAARAAGSCQVFIIDVSIARGGLTQVIGTASQKPLIAS